MLHVNILCGSGPRKLPHAMKFFLAGHVNDLDSRNFVRQASRKFCAISCTNGKWHLVGLPHTLQCRSGLLQTVGRAGAGAEAGAGAGTCATAGIGIKCQMGCTMHPALGPRPTRLTLISPYICMNEGCTCQRRRGRGWCRGNFAYLLPLCNTCRAAVRAAWA